jgi:hypothetical protein
VFILFFAVQRSKYLILKHVPVLVVGLVVGDALLLAGSHDHTVLRDLLVHCAKTRDQDRLRQLSLQVRVVLIFDDITPGLWEDFHFLPSFGFLCSILTGRRACWHCTIGCYNGKQPTHASAQELHCKQTHQDSTRNAIVCNIQEGTRAVRSKRLCSSVARGASSGGPSHFISTVKRYSRWTVPAIHATSIGSPN